MPERQPHSLVEKEYDLLAKALGVCFICNRARVDVYSLDLHSAAQQSLEGEKMVRRNIKYFLKYFR